MLPIQTMATVNGDSKFKPLYLLLSLMTHTTMMDTHAMDTHAMVAPGANISVMFSHIWETLGKPLLTPTDLTFLSFSKTETLCLGVTSFKLRIQDEQFYTNIHVVDQVFSLEDIILG